MKKQLGIFSHFGFDLPLEQRLKMIKDAGFDSTFILLEDEKDFIKKPETQKIPKLVRDCGLYLDHIHASYKDANLVWSEDLSGQEIIKTYYFDCVEFCFKYNIPHLVVHPSQSSTPPPLNESGLKIFKDLALLAQNKNVKIAIENTRVDEYTDFILSRIESENLGLCYDSSHDNLYGNPTFKLMKKWAKRILVTHLSDNLGDMDNHVLPWNGNYDWEKFVEVFSNINYKGILTLEVSREEEHNSPDDFLDLALERVERLYKMINE